jgi:hypothetical protein
MLEMTSLRIDARLKPLREVVDDLLAEVQRDRLPGLLDRSPQLLLTSVDPLADLLDDDAPERVVQRVQIRAAGWPDVLPPELAEVLKLVL